MDPNLVVVELAAQSILSLQEGAGTQLRCLQGTLWITEEASRRDVVLEAGQNYVLTGAGRAVVQAVGASRVALEAACGRPEFAFPVLQHAA